MRAERSATFSLQSESKSNFHWNAQKQIFKLNHLMISKIHEAEKKSTTLLFNIFYVAIIICYTGFCQTATFLFTLDIFQWTSGGPCWEIFFLFARCWVRKMHKCIPEMENFINFNKRKEFEKSPAEIDERKLCLKIEKFWNFKSVSKNYAIFHH